MTATVTLLRRPEPGFTDGELRALRQRWPNGEHERVLGEDPENPNGPLVVVADAYYVGGVSSAEWDFCILLEIDRTYRRVDDQGDVKATGRSLVEVLPA